MLSVFYFDKMLEKGVIILPITEKKKAANARWDSANLKRISVAMPVDLHTRMVRHIKETGETTNKFVKRAIDETIVRDETSCKQD